MFFKEKKDPRPVIKTSMQPFIIEGHGGLPAYFNAELFHLYLDSHKKELDALSRQFTPETLSGTFILDAYRVLNVDIDKFHATCGHNAFNLTATVYFYDRDKPADRNERFERFFKAIQQNSIYTEKLSDELYLTRSYNFDLEYISPFMRAEILSRVLKLGCELNDIVQNMYKNALDGKVQETAGMEATLNHYREYIEFIGYTYLKFDRTAIELLQAIPFAPEVEDLKKINPEKRHFLAKEKLVPAPLRPQYEKQKALSNGPPPKRRVRGL